MKYWLIYYDDFSNDSWVVRDHACFYRKSEAIVIFNNLSDDEHWYHLKEFSTKEPRDPIMKIA